MNNRIKDLTGMRFGRLVAVSYQGRGSNVTRWLFKCDCGNEKVIAAKHVTGKAHDRTVSCGCYRSEAVTTHGLSKTPEHRIWKDMWRRCSNQKRSDYQMYGGRGIQVCERWANFENFIEDMGERPSKKHSIDRIDGNGNYEPSNCRWATATQQSRNRSNNRLITINGETLCASEWAEKLGQPYKRLQMRLDRGWPDEIAVMAPGGTKLVDYLLKNLPD